MKAGSTTTQYWSGKHLLPKKEAGRDPIAGTRSLSVVTDAGRDPDAKTSSLA